MIQKARLIYQACMKIGEKDFNFLDKFIVLAEKDLQTTKVLLQKGDCLCKEVIVYMIYCLIPKNALSICDVLLRAVGRSKNLREQVVG